MNKLNFEEIITYLKSKMSYNYFVDNIENYTELGAITKVLEEFEFSNSPIKVILFEDHDVYVQIRGRYDYFEDKISYRSIHNLYDWLPVKEVRPFEIIKTIYKRVK